MITSVLVLSLAACRWERIAVEVDTSGDVPVFSFDRPINKLEVWAKEPDTECKADIARNVGDNQWFVYLEVGPGIPEASFVAPVTYGEVPPNALEDEPALALEPGVPYVLQLYLEAYDPEDSSFGTDAAGCTLFDM